MNKVDLRYEDWNDQLMVRLCDSDTISNGVTWVSINCGLPWCKYLCHFFCFVSSHWGWVMITWLSVCSILRHPWVWQVLTPRKSRNHGLARLKNFQWFWCCAWFLVMFRLFPRILGSSSLTTAIFEDVELSIVIALTSGAAFNSKYLGLLPLSMTNWRQANRNLQGKISNCPRSVEILTDARKVNLSGCK